MMRSRQELSQHLHAVVLHHVNTGICALWYVALLKGKSMIHCQQSKKIITHFAHKMKLKLTLRTKCQSTTSFHLEMQGIQI